MIRVSGFRRALLLGFCAAVAVAPLALAASTGVNPYERPVDRALALEIVEMLSLAKSPLRTVFGYLSMGSYSYPAWDRRANAQATVNLLEGTESQLFDPLDTTIEFPVGIRPHLADLPEVDPVRSWEGLLSMLRLASAAMVDVLEGDLDMQEVEDAFLTARVLLLRAYDDIDGILQAWGYEIWVSPGQSIQNAIATALEGATVYIEPGIYEEAIQITKSITLDGRVASRLPSLSSDGRSPGYVVTLKPVLEYANILIRSSEPIDVCIRRLNVEGGNVGIRVLGPANLVIEDVDVTECGAGVLVSDSASVEVVNGYFESNETGVFVGGTATLSLQDSHLRDSTTRYGGLQIVESASATVSGSFFQRNAGSGILLDGLGRLDIEDSYILYNEGDGILLAGGSQVKMVSSVITANKNYGIRALSETCDLAEDFGLAPFSGQITGSGNSISSSDTAMGNVLGLSCPDDLSFLIEPDPDDG